MRVISGKYRGKKLISPINDNVRPTTDKVKECVFNMLQFDIVGSNFLDLFSGSGAIGIEAISRGAEFVTMVDNSKDSLKVIKHNLSNIEGNFEILEKDYESAIKFTNKKYDIVYLDPPYVFNNIDKMLDLLHTNNVLNLNAIIIYESLYESNKKANNENYILQKSKKYGTICVDTYLYKG